MKQDQMKKDNDLFEGGEEEKRLLASVYMDKHRKDISRNSFMCDQPIELSFNSLDDAKIYCGVTKKYSQVNEESEVVEKVKAFTRQFTQLFKWSRDYDSFTQLYAQILFDGCALFCFAKQSKEFNSFLQSSKKDEIYNQKLKGLVDQNPPLVFTNVENASSQNQNIICRGNIKVNTAVANKSTQSSGKVQENKFTLVSGKSRTPVKLDDPIDFSQKSIIPNSNNKKNILSSVSATLASLYSANIFKSKIKIEEEIIGAQTYYLFGQKLISGGQENLKVSKIFKEFNFEKFKIDQVVSLIAILVTSGISIYFAAKLVKNMIYLAKKKKLFKRK